MYDIVLFDLDGTLTDSAPGITNSVAYALQHWGIEVEDKSQLRPFIGPPLRESFQKFYGFSEEDAELAVKYYREVFSVKGLFENSVYEGIPELLEKIKASGRKIVLATSKPEVFAVRILEHFGLAPYFDLTAGAVMDGTRDSKASVITYALQQFGLTAEALAAEAGIPADSPEAAALLDAAKEKVIMVGDREHDVLGAAENDLACIGVLYGFGDRAELEAAGAKYIAETPADILQYL
ncbi:MAG: HAD family hydrolase [Clostridiales bacterium]|nr:HAD family hydrolase [Clostridiales bacterium]